MVAYDNSREMIVVSFRATACGDNWKNGKTDFKYSKQYFNNTEDGGNCHLQSGCTMHRGFKMSYEWFKPHVRKAVSELVDKHFSKVPEK